MDLPRILFKLTRSRNEAESFVEQMAAEIGVPPDFSDRTLIALALCKKGRPPEEVGALLTWREFESFCSRLLTASGFRVRENVILKRPRAQIDLVAFGPSVVLSIDCKHWKRDHPPSSLRELAAKQLKRSRLLRQTHPDARPIVSTILSFSASQGNFVDGVAVVPVRTLRSFLSSFESYSDFLRFA